jgi:hypothetical protein
VSAEPTSPTPRHLGELPSLHLTRDEANALIHVLDYTAAALNFYERVDTGIGAHARAEQLLEVAGELGRRTGQGFGEAVRALPHQQARRLFEATWGERFDAALARMERADREVGHER